MSDYIVPHNRPTFSLEKSDKILRFKKAHSKRLKNCSIVTFENCDMLFSKSLKRFTPGLPEHVLRYVVLLLTRKSWLSTKNAKYDMVT